MPFYIELLIVGCSEYCLINAAFGGQATKDIGRALGKGIYVKKVSLSIYSMVALLEGSFINIFEINLLIVCESVIFSGKL